MDRTPSLKTTRRRLLEYYSLLKSSHLTNSMLCGLALPDSLGTKAAVASRLYTIPVLVRDSMSVMIRLPLFLVPLIMHIPAYVLAWYGGKLVEDEEETQAQNKVGFGLLAVILTFSTVFFVLWRLMMYTVVGALISGGAVYLFGKYHREMIDGEYGMLLTCMGSDERKSILDR